MILFICDVPEVLKVMKIINTIIMIIKIAVPIILIITGMICFTKAITDDKDGVSGALKLFSKRLVAASTILLNIVSFEHNYTDCFNNATDEKIEQLYIAKLDQLIKETKESYKRENYYKTSDCYKEIKDKDLKEKYQKELDDILSVIEEKEKQEKEQIEYEQTIIHTEEEAPTTVSGYDYITAKSPATSDTAEFLKVAKSTWLSIVNGSTSFHYQDWTKIPIPEGQNYIDCSGYVSQALYNFGYVVGNGGYQASTSTFYETNYKNKYGWQEIPVGATDDITNIVQPGDIVVRVKYYYDSSGKKKFKGHTNIVASVTDGNILVYDAGGDASIKHGAYPNGYPALYSNFYKSADGRPGKIIRVTKK